MVSTLMTKGKLLPEKTLQAVRVRFAPAPTGKMHLGSARTALENYLFAHKHHGTFVLRIEDTDAGRNFDPEARDILADLAWLNLTFDEGPFFQSQRTAFYQEKLDLLAQQKSIYRCFCTHEELEKKHERQVALKKPPRYDRTCCALTDKEIEDRLAAHMPFIWRFRLDETQTVTFNDYVRGELHFDLANFSDFPLTRQDGSFTFIFANVVDDILMNISHVLRGDEHLSNTVIQIALFKALNVPIPTYRHLPVLCKKDGKKLSKRDFGFSLEDLKQDGYLPEALINYLGVVGYSVQDEIMPLEKLITELPDHPSSTSHMTYDLDKLNWVNHKWIERLSLQALVIACTPFMEKEFTLTTVSPQIVEHLIELVRTDLVKLSDVVNATRFYFQRSTPPTIDTPLKKIITECLPKLDQPTEFVEQLKLKTKQAQLKTSDVFPLIRTILIGSPKGPNLHGIIEVLGQQEARIRLESAID